MRGVTYRNKINKVVNKFMSRMKWVPLRNKYDIFEKAIEGGILIKNANIKRQTDMLDRVQSRVHKIHIMTSELKAELAQLLDSYYCRQYEQMYLSNVEKTIYSWKANHDQVPGLIPDQQLLKLKIQDAAAQHSLTGDIELDHGYSFSYQVTVFFPSYFQKQVIKSQFSIYDAFAGEEEDPNQKQKRVLTTATRIDMNIFLDVSTTKNTVPTEEAFQSEFRNSDIKILRLKSAAYWIDYVALQPIEPDWHFKQQAILNNDNPLDTLLQQALNFLDVNDLATVNRINEDNAHLHQENLRKLEKHNPHNLLIRSQISTVDGDKKVTVDQMQFKNSNNQASNIETHLLQAVQDPDLQEKDQRSQSKVETQSHTLKHLPTHLLVSYNTLRFLSSRDAKNRILYTLNYFRSVQKRLALDLREFATRDRIEGHLSNPFIQSKEANHNIINQSNLAAKSFDVKDGGSAAQIDSGHVKKMTVFDSNAIKEMKDMATLRGYKTGGLFNSRIFHTCPSFPKFHATHGEPLVKMSEAEEMDRSGEGRTISDRAIKLMGRIDFVEINEALKEVYVKDDFGIYIIYDCVLQDMKFIEKELAKVGSYYLHKSETLLDPEKQEQGVRAYPFKDRLELLDDMLQKESDFQFAKVKLIQVYLECYEHVCDPLEQQKLMQVITDIMSRRPRLNLNANYFVDAYDAETLCLQKQFELVKTLVDLQISLEKTENKRLQDSLNLSYTLANQFSKNKWKYQDAESLLQAIEKTRQAKEEADQYVKNMQQKEKEEIELDKQKNQGSISEGSKTAPSQLDSQMAKKNTNREPIDDGLSSEMSLDEAEYYKNDENQFTQLLGLPQITIETIYQSYREKDKNIVKMMREHSNFIAVYEGYPEFLTMLTHRSILDKNRLFKPNLWSQETGALDFYDSLDFVTKFYAVTQQVQQELYDGLKMWDATLMTQIDIQVAELGIEELRRIQSYMDGSKIEYQGRELLEDEQIMGNSEKLIFYAKEMIADLTNKPKHLVDPYLISKLDIQTINFFDFPKVKQEFNKYTMRKNGIAGAEYMAISEKEAITRIAKDKTNKGVSEILGGKVGDVLNRRNIFVPSMLQTYLNMVELHRLRNELILAASETAILQEVYVKQCELVGLRNSNTQLPEGISFDQYDYTDSSEIKLVNFVDHGPSHADQIALTASEFDPVLLSNINFRNPDSFKINILTSGLEEVRAILSYQLLQKTLLIVATRTNSMLIDSYLRAMSELNLVEKSKIAIPNSIVQYSAIINKSQDVINLQSAKMMRSNYKQSMGTFCMPIFYNVVAKKNQNRTSIAKEFSNYQISAQNKFSVNPYCVLRVMRSLKVKLLVKFVQNIMTEVCLDAQKVQALQACQRLRYYNRYFSFEPQKLGLTGDSPQILKLETSGMIENFPANYAPDHLREKEDKLSQALKKKEDVKIINTSSYEILDYAGIPSSVSIMQTDAVPLQDLRDFKDKRKEFGLKKWGKEFSEELKEVPPEINDPEIHLKQLLMSFSPYNLDESESGAPKKSAEDLELQLKKKIGGTGSALLDYEEALYFGNSQYGNMIKYYITLERVLALEWFIAKLQFSPNEVINMEHALECGLPFWKEDEFDARVKSTLTKTPNENSVNLRAQQFFFDQIIGIRSKRFIAEAVNSMGLTIKSFIAQFIKTKQELRSDYLTQYVEFRYQQIAGSLHKLVQQFYYQKNMEAVNNVQTAIQKFTKMDHVRFFCLKPNNYSINMSLVNPLLINLESGNLIYGSMQNDEILNFTRAVKPIINEKALEPSQITLFQALYQSDSFRRNSPSQYAGQICSERVAFKALETALLGLSVKERQYSQSFIVQAKYQANDFMETVFGDTSMASLTNEDVYSLSQLIDAKKFINEGTQALLLKNALICWFENSVLPNDAETYEKFEKNFRQNFFWKQLEQKEDIAKKLQQANTFGQIPTQEQLKELKTKIDKMVNNHNLATQSEVEQRDALVKVLREEFASLKKKVTLDNYFSTKAEIQVYSNEIEKFVINASVKTLDSECAALAKCFTIQIPQIQYHIHPFQQFAATFFDQVDPNMHLDISNKVIAVQSLITKMRNRGTEVETLTSGPGMVFTIKDINEILIDFCNTTIKDQEKQFKSRTELYKLTEENYRNIIYQKDQKINSLEHRIKNIGINLENIIDARLFEKGNQLIYELDSSNRVLSLFKSAMFGLERNLYETIIGEQLHKFKRNLNQLELKTRKFDDYKRAILNMVNADFAADQDRIKVILKEMADQAKNTEKEGIVYKKSAMYPITGALHANRQINKAGDHQASGAALTGAVVPHNYKHYPECSCYTVDPKYPKPTMELAGLEILTEREARDELARTSILVRKQRIVFRVKEMFMMKKYQDKINLLEKQLTNNSHLWDQLAESQKRERVLKQELLYTQQSHSTSEKIIDKMKEEIKQLEAERGRLAKFKSSKAEKLKELEEKVKKIDLFENIDGDKLLAALTKKDQQLREIQSNQNNAQFQVEAISKRRDQEVQKLKRQFAFEQQKTQTMIDRMDQMKLELKMLEANDSSVATIWKKKCLDLFELCQSMKVENDELRDRCKELIEQGIILANAMGDGKIQTSHVESSLPQVNSSHKQNPYMSKRGQLASTANTFQRSIADTPQRDSMREQPDPYEYLPASAPWGVKSPESNHVHHPVQKIGYQTHQRGRTQGPGKDIRSILSGSGDKYTLQNQQVKINKALTKPTMTEYVNSAKNQYQSAVNRRKNLQSQDSQSAQTGFRQVTAAEPSQIFKLKNATRLIKIEQVPASFDVHGKTILNPKLPETHTLTVSQQVSHGKNWTSLNVNATTELRDGKVESSNDALSSQRITVNDKENASLLSTQNVASNQRERPVEIREENYPPNSAKSEEFTVNQQIEE